MSVLALAVAKQNGLIVTPSNRTHDTLLGNSEKQILAKLLNVPLSVDGQGEQALRTGDRSARGVAQDAPFFTAVRLERRAGALTETGISYEVLLERTI